MKIIVILKRMKCGEMGLKNHPIFRKGGLELETKIKLLAVRIGLPLMQW